MVQGALPIVVMYNRFDVFSGYMEGHSIMRFLALQRGQFRLIYGAVFNQGRMPVGCGLLGEISCDAGFSYFLI